MPIEMSDQPIGLEQGDIRESREATRFDLAPGFDLDVIFDVTDDGLEPDYGYANVRMWNNRITNVSNNSLSFQPQYCGPWYFIRNQVVGGAPPYRSLCEFV